MTSQTLIDLIERYKSDPESVYNTWFVSGEERMKAFRSIRRGVRDTVNAIVAGSFGADFKGSPLEVVLNAVTEQKQVFEGAAHPFFWKPKLRIPDIYENEPNKRRFAAFLDSCLSTANEEKILSEISRLSAAGIKGLGPSVANIIYFLHPTIVPPFNTAMVNGFNVLFADKKKLGSWESYLAMREVIIRTNAEARDLLSNDLGAFAGLLFEVGSGRLPVRGSAIDVGVKTDAEKAALKRHQDVISEHAEDSEHTRMQYLLIKTGRALKYEVHVARNDRHRSCEGQAFSLMTIPELPPTDWPPDVRDTVALIDVIWLKPGTADIVGAFEVEKSTSIYSGILRLEDLARSLTGCRCDVYLVAPDSREKDVMAQLARPAFRDDLGDIPLAFIPFNELSTNWEGLCRFGCDAADLRKIARRPVGGDQTPASREARHRAAPSR